MSQLKPTTSSVYITMPLRGQLDIWTIMLSFSSRKKLDFMYPEELAHCSIIGLIWRERGNCIGNKARQNVTHIFIAARVTEIGFSSDGDLYIELVEAEVLLVKSTHQLSVWGKRRK